MKKLLTLIVALVLGSASFAANTSISAWDIPLHQKKVKFTDPFVTDFTIDVVTYQGFPHVHFWWKLNAATPYHYKATIGVYGNWVGNPWWYKYFDIIIYQGNAEVNRYFKLEDGEEAWTNIYDFTYEGPL